MIIHLIEAFITGWLWSYIVLVFAIFACSKNKKIQQFTIRKISVMMTAIAVKQMTGKSKK